MNTWKLRKFDLVNLTLLCRPLMIVAFLYKPQTTATAQVAGIVTLSFTSNASADRLLRQNNSFSQPPDQGLAVRHSRPEIDLRSQPGLRQVMPADRQW